MTGPVDGIRRAPFVQVRAGVGGHHEVTGDRAARLGFPGAGGMFAEWRWDGARLTVRSDPYGMVPLFYWATPGRVALSTGLADLLAAGAPTDLDHDALAVFIRMGFFLGDDTPFESIRAVPPGAGLQWAPGTLRVDGKQPIQGRREIGRARAIDTYLGLVRQAIERTRPDGDHVLPLSGGRDSRHILLELVARGAPPRLAVTTAKFVQNDADTRTAARLAATVGVPHRVIPRPRSQLRAELASNLAQQLCTTEGAWLLPLSRYVRANSAVTYDGLGGDALVQSPFLHLARRQESRATAPETARWLIEGGRRDRYLSGLLSPRLERLLSTRRAVDRLSAELLAHADAAFPLMSFYFWNRTRRAIAAGTFSLLGRGGEVMVHTPFLDEELYRFCASLPPEILLDGAFHTEALRRGYPSRAHLPFADEATGHGPRFMWDRTAYVADVLTTATVHKRHWWRAWDGLLARLLFRGAGRSRIRTVNRLLPFAVYLMQLDDLRECRGNL